MTADNQDPSDARRGRHGTAVVREANDEHQGLLGRLFDHITEYRTRARAELGEHFDLRDIERAEPHSPLLSKTAALEPRAMTLTERVRQILLP